MPLLTGRHSNKVDKKGRVSVPKLFRDFLEERGFAGLYVYPSFKYPALEGCGEDVMRQISDSLEDLDMFSDEQEDLATAILENAHSLTWDPEGRIMLPRELAEYAGISDQALFVGFGKRLQIWSPAEYEKNRGPALDRLRARGATLRLRRPSADGSDTS